MLTNRAMKYNVVNMLFKIEKTLVVLATNIEMSGYVTNILMIPKFSR